MLVGLRAGDALRGGRGRARLSPIVVGACGMWVIGTIDDRHPLSASLALGIEALIAVALWVFGLGWDVFEATPLISP